jgi:hypothetical protein
MNTAFSNDKSKNQDMATLQQNQNTRKPVMTISHDVVSFPHHKQVYGDRGEEEEEEEDGAGEIFGVILRRTCSVSNSSAFSDVLWANEKQKKNSTVRRVLSMRKSSSPVSEGYCRIHHRCDPLAKDDDDDDEAKSMQAERSKKKKGKLLKACRRLFGF